MRLCPVMRGFVRFGCVGSLFRLRDVSLVWLVLMLAFWPLWFVLVARVARHLWDVFPTSEYSGSESVFMAKVCCDYLTVCRAECG